MGPYGSIWGHIKTGRSPMAHDHFHTPPDRKRVITIQFESYFWLFVTEKVSMIWNVRFGSMGRFVYSLPTNCKPLIVYLQLTLVISSLQRL